MVVLPVRIFGRNDCISVLLKEEVLGYLLEVGVIGKLIFQRFSFLIEIQDFNNFESDNESLSIIKLLNYFFWELKKILIVIKNFSLYLNVIIFSNFC